MDSNLSYYLNNTLNFKVKEEYEKIKCPQCDHSLVITQQKICILSLHDRIKDHNWNIENRRKKQKEKEYYAYKDRLKNEKFGQKIRKQRFEKKFGNPYRKPNSKFRPINFKKIINRKLSNKDYCAPKQFVKSCASSATKAAIISKNVLPQTLAGGCAKGALFNAGMCGLQKYTNPDIPSTSAITGGGNINSSSNGLRNSYGKSSDESVQHKYGGTSNGFVGFSIGFKVIPSGSSNGSGSSLGGSSGGSSNGSGSSLGVSSGSSWNGFKGSSNSSGSSLGGSSNSFKLNKDDWIKKQEDEATRNIKKQEDEAARNIKKQEDEVARNLGYGKYQGFPNRNLLDFLNKLSPDKLDWLMNQKTSDLDWIVKLGEKKCNSLTEQRTSNLVSKKEFKMPQLSSNNKDKSSSNTEGKGSSSGGGLDKNKNNDKSFDKQNEKKSDLFSLDRVMREMKSMEAVMKAEQAVKQTCHTNNNLSNVKNQADKECSGIIISNSKDLSSSNNGSEGGSSGGESSSSGGGGGSS